MSETNKPFESNPPEEITFGVVSEKSENVIKNDPFNDSFAAKEAEKKTKLEEIRKKLDEEIIVKSQQEKRQESGEKEFDVGHTSVNVKWHRFEPKILTK